MRVPVVSIDNNPLMPTTPARARKWLASGKAIKCWSKCGQFYVQLTRVPSGYATQDISIGLDPGKKYSGIGVQSARFTLYSAHLILPFQTISERLTVRRLMRRSRRRRKINRKVPFHLRSHRQNRLLNRRRRGIPPSIRASRQLEIKVVSELCKIYPVVKICYEYTKVDVDLKSGRKKARSGVGFSPVMVGQRWMLQQLMQSAPVVKVAGYQTAAIRNHLGLHKNKTDKSKSEFATHAVDGVALAATHFVEYKKYHGIREDGANWFGFVTITSASFFVIRRPPFSRRQLHLMMPAKGGIRRKYGGSTTPFNIRKGDLVRYANIIGFCSGYTGKSISVSDYNWKRLGKYAASKVELVARSQGLLTERLDKRRTW